MFHLNILKKKTACIFFEKNSFVQKSDIAPNIRREIVSLKTGFLTFLQQYKNCLSYSIQFSYLEIVELSVFPYTLCMDLYDKPLSCSELYNEHFFVHGYPIGKQFKENFYQMKYSNAVSAKQKYVLCATSFSKCFSFCDYCNEIPSFIWQSFQKTSTISDHFSAFFCLPKSL